jgi:hypothetical protein
MNCYFCDSFHDPDSIFISEYNGVQICYECTLYEHKPISIYDNINCSVCYDDHKGIELPNCNHIICIDCYKKIYFGFITNDQCKKPVKRENTFIINETLHERLGNYDFSQSVDVLLEHIHNTKSKTKTKEYIDYETSFIIYCKKQYDLDLQDIQYYKNKASNIFNTSCPLCRK